MRVARNPAGAGAGAGARRGLSPWAKSGLDDVMTTSGTGELVRGEEGLGA